MVSENLVFKSKQTTMESSVSVMVSALSGLDKLTSENVAKAMTVAEETAASRVIVTDATGYVLYDTREMGSAKGSYALYTEIAQALAGNDAFYSKYEGGAFMSRAASPVIYRSHILGAVYAYEYDAEQAMLLKGLETNLERISLFVGALVILISFVLSKALTGRIGELLKAIRIVREGEYSHRTELGGYDELAQIATEFNSLTDRLQKTEESRRRFVSDASHELKTPLASIRLLSDSILQTDQIDKSTVREFVGDIGSEAERLTRISEELLRLTKIDSAAPTPSEPVDAAGVIDKVLRMLSILAAEKGVELRREINKNATVLCTEDGLFQIVYNLVENGIKYNRDGGFVTVTLGENGGAARITVADDGIGVPENELTKIFDRFYRVDKARSRAAGGTGLGLAIVRDTALLHGGSVTAAPREGGGTVFTVTLRLAGKGGEAQ